MFEWKTLFQVEIGIRLVKVEKGGGNVLRLTTATPDMEDPARVRAPSPGILKEKMIRRCFFSEEEADEITQRIMKS